MSTETLTAARVDAETLRAQVTGVLRAWGMPAGPAQVTADVMVDTDLSGIDSHGVSMLMMYQRLLGEGRLRLAEEPVVVRDLPAVAVLDGRGGLGHPVAVRAMDLAVEKARRLGMGAVAVGGSNHFGAAGYYVRRAAAAGLIGLATTTTPTPVVSATGGTTPVLGTNPLAFAAPREDGEPLVVDMSTSVVAVNKVKSYGLAGTPLPHGWVFDRAGEPVRDADLGHRLLQERRATIAPLGGADTATGGHKGYGLALMVHVLSAALSNAEVPGERSLRDIGHFFLALDPELVNPGGGSPRTVEGLLRAVQAGEPDVLVPGQPEEAARAERARHGVPVPESLRAHLRAICAEAGTPYLLD